MKLLAARLFFCLLLFLGQALPLRADNDKFAEATDLATFALPYYGFIGGGGTAEAGEPAHAGSPAAHSYWFRWTPTTSAPCIIREFLNTTNTRIAIYTGNTLATLNVVAQGTEHVFFPTTAGVTYRIAIDSVGADVFQFKTYPPGGTDDLASATPITGALPQRLHGNNVFATTTAATDEDWYPSAPPQATVWWRWTAPAAGAIRLDSRLSDFETRLTAYERAPGGSPVRVSLGFSTCGMKVQAGYDYLFCIDGTNNRGEIDFWLESIPTTIPPNDNLANATNLGSALIACDGGWIFNATAETGVPNETITPWSYDHTLWWKWTCPQSGTYRFSQLGSDGSAGIYVFTGTPGSLTMITGLDLPEGVRIESITAGTTYYIQIKDWKWSAVRAELNIHPAATEPRYFTNFGSRGYFRLLGPQRHPAADPDGDGFSNEIEFACGTNPEVYNPNDPNLPRLTVSSGTKTFSWVEDSTYLTTTPGQPISLKAQTSTNLSPTWLDATATSSSGGRKTITLPNSTRAFARLNLTDPNWNPTP
ncbi:thrombospondin type 3 repeat-containing protein [Luteolibacter soli]|uniref:Thrombospondin type 3 repeat-containing protein n=1 Tax=Luteolibacter soli TaxID=3135280 RepID=A0ABU9AUJ4_9BACT